MERPMPTTVCAMCVEPHLIYRLCVVLDWTDISPKSKRIAQTHNLEFRNSNENENETRKMVSPCVSVRMNKFKSVLTESKWTDWAGRLLLNKPHRQTLCFWLPQTQNKRLRIPDQFVSKVNGRWRRRVGVKRHVKKMSSSILTLVKALYSTQWHV